MYFTENGMRSPIASPTTRTNPAKIPEFWNYKHAVRCSTGVFVRPSQALALLPVVRGAGAMEPQPSPANSLERA